MFFKNRNLGDIVPKSSDIMDEHTITDDPMAGQYDSESYLEVCKHLIRNIKNVDLRMSKKSRYFV